MKFRQFFNEKGMTLVELLGALGLFTVVIALSSTVIVQLITSEDKTANNVKDTQELNVIVSDLKIQFDNERENVCINNNNILIKETSNGVISESQKCIQNIDYTNPLHIKVGAVNSEIEVVTTLAKKEGKTIEIAVNNESQEEEDDFNEEDYSTWNRNDCEIDGDTKFEHNIMQSNTPCQPEHKIEVRHGSAWFPNNTRIGIHYFEVENNLYSDREFVLESSNKDFIIGGNAIFKGSLKVRNANIIIHGDATFYEDIDLHNDNNSNITINGNAIFHNEAVSESIKDKITVEKEIIITQD